MHGLYLRHHSIGMAAREIMYGYADAMLCGGAEMATTPVGIGGFGAARALSTRNDNPQAASRPWDKGRDGFVLGDGAGVLVLKTTSWPKPVAQRSMLSWSVLAPVVMLII